VYDELDGARDEDEPDDEPEEEGDEEDDDPLYDELEGTEVVGEADEPADPADPVDGAAGDAAGEEAEAGDEVVGVNDGCRLCGVKTDSRSGLESSALDAFRPDDFSSVALDAFLGFPIRSAGSGGTPPRSGLAGSSLAFPPALPRPFALPLAAGADAGAAAEGAEALELPLSPVRDDDMMPLLTTASSFSTSGSVSRTGGAIMNGVRVVGPASSTPSSSVLTGPLRTFA
jgi:hypothetical protein